jgi:PAS domain S-box-containing protein
MTEVSVEEGLRLLAERYRALIAALAEIVWTTDARGQMGGDQPGWQACTGQTSAEIQGTGWLAAVHPESRSEAVSAWTRAVTQDSRFDAEWRVRRRDGEFRHFSIRAAPARDPDGNIREWVGCCIDITEQAQAGAALAQLERQGRELKIVKNLSDTLQACNSRDEAYPFIAMAATELFAGASGALAVPVPGAPELLETATAWGQDLVMKPDFAIEDCWALRRGRMHEPAPGTICHHFETPPKGSYACIPLAVRGEVCGLLSLQLMALQPLDDDRRSALSLFGNAIALGLSLLQLRETLQKHANGPSFDLVRAGR